MSARNAIGVRNATSMCGVRNLTKKYVLYARSVMRLIRQPTQQGNEVSWFYKTFRHRCTGEWINESCDVTVSLSDKAGGASIKLTSEAKAYGIGGRGRPRNARHFGEALEWADVTSGTKNSANGGWQLLSSPLTLRWEKFCLRRQLKYVPVILHGCSFFLTHTVDT